MKFSIAFILVFSIFLQSDLKAQEITMFPGFWGVKYYQDDVKISKGEVGALMAKDKEANQLWKKSKKHMTIAWVAIGAEFGFLIWQTSNANNNDDQVVPLIGVLASAGVAIGFTLSANNLQKDAILAYNRNADLGKINFGPTVNGVGLVWSF